MRRVGRRGFFLLFFGWLAAVYSYSLLTRPPTESPHLQFASHIMPLYLWAVLWGVTSLACHLCAFLTQDRFGFAAIMGCTTAWGLTSAGGQLLGAIERGYLSASIWLGVALLSFVVSTWPEHDDRGMA